MAFLLEGVTVLVERFSSNFAVFFPPVLRRQTIKKSGTLNCGLRLGVSCHGSVDLPWKTW